MCIRGRGGRNNRHPSQGKKTGAWRRRSTKQIAEEGAHVQTHLFKPTGALFVPWKQKENGCILRHGCANMSHGMQMIDTAKTRETAHERWKFTPSSHCTRQSQKRPPTTTRRGQRRNIRHRHTATGIPYLVSCTSQPHQRLRKGIERQGPFTPPL